MSSKDIKIKEEHEPISIETTILKINVKTTGDFITKEYDLIPFHPNMSDLRDLSNNSYILFPSFVKITLKDLQNAKVDEDYTKLFLNLEKYLKLIKYVTGNDPKREKIEDYTLLTNRTMMKDYATSLAQNAADLLSDNTSDVISLQKYDALTEEEIINNNVELIKSLFFRPDSHFFILGNDYVIGESKYIPPYVPSKERNEKIWSETSQQIPLAYTITIELQLLDAVNNPGAGDFSRLSCKAKKGSIAKDSKDLFGFNFGYVPEVKASIPSILNTAQGTKSRQFGKIQKEWEERNKYVKPPATESERRAMEKNWTPLQRKMAEFEQNQESIKKIPALWIKEREDLEKKYAAITTELVQLCREMKEMESSDLDPVRAKIFATLEPVMTFMEYPENARAKAESLLQDIAEPEKYIKELKDKLVAYQQLKQELEEKEKNTLAADIKKNYENELNDLAQTIFHLKTLNDYIKTLEDMVITQKNDIGKVQEKIKREIKNKENPIFFYLTEKDAIDEKYIATLISGYGLPEKRAALQNLERNAVNLRIKLSKSDPYNADAIKMDLSKVEATIRKSTSDIKILEDKYGKDKLIKKWEEALENKEYLTKNIESEKTNKEKKTQQRKIRDDLDMLLKDMRKDKRELLISKYKTGDDNDLTKDEKKEFEKAERPDDDPDEIEKKIERKKREYFETADKLGGFFYKIEYEIKLLNDEVAHYKKLKAGKESEKEEKNKKIREITTEISRLPKEEYTDETGVKKKIESERLITLKKDQQDLTNELNQKINNKIETYKSNIKEYEDYIKKLQGIKEKGNVKSEYKRIYDERKETIHPNLDPESQSGGAHTKKKIHKKNKKTKRRAKKYKKKTLRNYRKAKREMRKRKTIRRYRF